MHADLLINTDKTSQMLSAAVATSPRVFLLALIDDDARGCLLISVKFSAHTFFYQQHLVIVVTAWVKCNTEISLNVHSLLELKPMLDQDC